MKSNARFILITLISLSILMGVYESFLYSRALQASLLLSLTWDLVFLILIASWVNEDSKHRPNIYRPFEYGFLVFIFYIFYLPYYLLKTRGVIKGIGMLLGLIVFNNLAWVFQWAIYWLD